MLPTGSAFQRTQPSVMMCPLPGSNIQDPEQLFKKKKQRLVEMMQTTAMLEPHLSDQAICMSVVGKPNIFCVGAALQPPERISRCISQNTARQQEADGSLPCIIIATFVGLLQDRRRRLLSLRSPPIRKLVMRGPFHLHFLSRDPHCPVRDGAKLRVRKSVSVCS